MRQDSNQQDFMNLLAELRNSHEHLSSESVALFRSRVHPGRFEAVIGVVDDFVGRDDPLRMVIAFTNITPSCTTTSFSLDVFPHTFGAL